MKKRILILILTAAMFLLGFGSYHEEVEPKMHKLNATAYCLQGITYTGKKVRNGIAASGRKEWLGMTALVYQRMPDDSMGDLIGIYEIEDTGCSEYVLDIWCSDLDRCQDFMDAVYEDGCQGRVYVEVIKAYG